MRENGIVLAREISKIPEVTRDAFSIAKAMRGMESSIYGWEEITQGQYEDVAVQLGMWLTGQWGSAPCWSSFPQHRFADPGILDHTLRDTLQLERIIDWTTEED